MRAQWLGQQLHELRETRGFTLRQVADYLERDPSTVSRFESAEYPIRRPDLLALLDFYDVHDEQRRQALMTLREEAWRKGRWDDYADAVDRQFIDYPWLESRATQICSYDAVCLPGLTQTRAYAETVIRQAEGPDAAEEQIARWIDLRMDRQRVLDKRDGSLRLAVVLDESTLRRPVGGRQVMREQLAHLIELAQQPNVDLQVLPFSVGWHHGFDGAFKLFRLPDPYPDVAYVESLAGRLYVESPHAERFRQAYEGLREAALERERSIQLISAIAEEMT